MAGSGGYTEYELLVKAVVDASALGGLVGQLGEVAGTAGEATAGVARLAEGISSPTARAAFITEFQAQLASANENIGRFNLGAKEFVSFQGQMGRAIEQTDAALAGQIQNYLRSGAATDAEVKSLAALTGGYERATAALRQYARAHSIPLTAQQGVAYENQSKLAALDAEQAAINAGILRPLAGAPRYPRQTDEFDQGRRGQNYLNLRDSADETRYLGQFIPASGASLATEREAQLNSELIKLNRARYPQDSAGNPIEADEAQVQQAYARVLRALRLWGDAVEKEAAAARDPGRPTPRQALANIDQRVAAYNPTSDPRLEQVSYGRAIAEQRVQRLLDQEAGDEVQIGQAKKTELRAVKAYNTALEKITAEAEAQAAQLQQQKLAQIDTKVAGVIGAAGGASVAGDPAVRSAALSQVQADNAYTAVKKNATATEEELIRAQRAQIGATRALTAAVERAQTTQAAAGAPPRGPFGNFLGGLTGGPGGGFGSDSVLGQLGATFKYIAFYEAFILLVRGAEDAVRANAEFQRSVTTLSIAMDTNRDTAARLANEYGQVGTSVGLAASKTVDAASSYIRAFPDANPEAAGQIGANTAAQLGVLGDPKELGKSLVDVRAIIKGFNLDVQGASTVMDSATVAAQGFGFALTSDVLPGVALIGNQAREAGFSLQETSSIIASIMAETGESADAVAGSLKRIFGRTGQDSFQQILSAYGVDTTQNFRDELNSLVQKLQSADPTSRSRTLNDLGGTRGGPELAALVASWLRIKEVSDAALNGQGQAQDQVNKRLGDMLGLLQRLGGAMKELSKDIGASGLLDIFGVAAQLLLPLIQGVDSLVSAFQLIPSPLRDIVITLGEIAGLIAVINREAAATALAKIGTGLAAGGGLIGIGRGANTSSLANNTALFAAMKGETAAHERATTATNQNAGATEQLSLIEEEEVAARQRNIAATNLETGTKETLAASDAEAAGANGLGAVKGLKGFGPAAIVATIGLIALGEVKDQADKLNQAMATAAAALSGFQSANLNTDDLQGRIDALYTARGQLDTSWKDSVFNGGQGKEKGAEIDAQIAYLKSIQERVKATQGSPGAPPAFASYYGAQGTDFVQALAAMKNNAIPAATAVRLFTDAVGLAGATAKTAASRFTVQGSFAGDVSRAAVPQSTIDRLNTDLHDPNIVGVGNTSGTINPDAQINFQAEISKTVGDYIDKNHLQGKPLNENQKQQIAEKASENIQAQLAPLIKNPAELAAIGDLTYKNTIAWINGQQAAGAQAATGQLDKNAIANLIQAGPDIVNTLIQEVGQLNDPAARAHLAQLIAQGAAKAVADAQAAHTDAQGMAPLVLAMQQANDNLAQVTVQNGQQLIAAIKSQGKDNKATRNKVVAAARAMLQATAATGDVDATIQALSGFGKAGAAAVLNSIKGALITVENAIKAEEAIIEAAAASVKTGMGVLGSMAGGVGGGVGALAQENEKNDPKLKPLYAQMAVLDKEIATIAKAIPNVKFDNSYLKGGYGDGTGGTSGGETAAQRAAAQLDAQAIPGDDLSQARIAVGVAKINLAAAKKGSVEYWNDVKALREAQYQLATVEQKLSNEAYLLSHDSTNPLVQAQAKVNADLAKLRYDRSRGANTTEDRLTLKQDQSALARTKFDQTLQDYQTNYDLNRISYQAYIRYLESQHNYLTAIKHRTYDQQQELNEVDQAMKAAADALQGQFNIGDIKIPTVYEVRRYIAAQAAGAGGGTVTNTININGTDIALVKKALEEILGPTASQTRTNVGRKS